MASFFWLDRPVFLTGATGLLGGHLGRALIEEGALVVALVRDTNSQSGWTREKLGQHAVEVRGDCRNGALLKRILAEYEIDTVFHLAAQTLVGPANLDPVSTFETNIAGTWRLLEGCRELPHVRQIVLASSDMAYGESEPLPFTEKARLEGRQPYAVSKSCADLLAQSYHHTFGSPVCITRCGNIYGPGDLNWNRIVPGTVRSLLRGQAPVIRSNGKSFRDYIYVRDCVSAFLQLAQQMESNRALCGQAFNFGHNTPLSVWEMVRHITSACGREDLQPVVLDKASNEIKGQRLDATKAREELVWRPQWSLEQGLQETVEWYRKLLG